MTSRLISTAKYCSHGCLPYIQRDLHLVGVATVDVKHNEVQTKKKPCVTLHVRPAKAVSKPKVSLRPNPPHKEPGKAPKKVPKKTLKQVSQPKSMGPGP